MFKVDVSSNLLRFEYTPICQEAIKISNSKMNDLFFGNLFKICNFMSNSLCFNLINSNRSGYILIQPFKVKCHVVSLKSDNLSVKTI